MGTGQKLSGLNPLAYMGVEPTSPPEVLINKEAPTTSNHRYNVGTFWIVQDPPQIWILADVDGTVATWAQLFPGAGSGATDFPTDFGTAVEAGGILEIHGSPGGLISTHGVFNNVLIHLENGNDGQVIIGGGTDAGWNTITSNDSSILITGGPNTLNLTASRFAELLHFVGTNVNAAVVSTGTLGIFGDFPLGGCIKTNGASNSVFITLEGGTNGQIPIAGVGTKWGNITSLDGSIAVVNGANTIDISSVAVPGVSKAFCMVFPAPDVGVPSSSPAVPYYFGTTQALSVSSLDNGFDNTGGAIFVGDGLGAPATFTAPATGNYSFSLQNSLQFPTSESVQSLFFLLIDVNGKLVFSSQCPNLLTTNSKQRDAQALSVSIHLTSGDVVKFAFLPPAAFGKTYRILGKGSALGGTGSSDTVYTYISGFLIQ